MDEKFKLKDFRYIISEKISLYNADSCNFIWEGYLSDIPLEYLDFGVYSIGAIDRFNLLVTVRF